jgi:hypothetical protein
VLEVDVLPTRSGNVQSTAGVRSSTPEANAANNTANSIARVVVRFLDREKRHESGLATTHPGASQWELCGDHAAGRFVVRAGTGYGDMRRGHRHRHQTVERWLELDEPATRQPSWDRE